MKGNAKSVFLLLAASATSGLGFYLADFPAHFPALQWVALAPLLYVILSNPPGLGGILLAGAIFGVLSNFLVFHLGMGVLAPAIMILYSVAWNVVLFMVPGIVARVLKRRLIAAFLFPPLVVTVDFVSQRLLGWFGTAQSFSRAQTAFPLLIQVAAVTGQEGVTFLVALTNTSLAALLAFRRETKSLLAFMTFFVLVVGASLAYDVAAFYGGKPARTVRVAAVGYIHKGFPGRDWNAKLARIEEKIGEGKADCDLVVYPEVAFWIRKGQMPDFRSRLEMISRKHGVFQFAGYFDVERDRNGIMLAKPDGAVRHFYTKTHLIMYAEKYHPGSGDVATVRVGGVAVSGMICQDDNFQDIARRIGGAGAGLVVIPTNDWKKVKDYHAENMIYRAVENRFSVVRAASNGISQIIDYRGVVLARRDPFVEGEGRAEILTADVPVVRAEATFFTAHGSVFAWLCMIASLFLFAAAFLRRRIC
jgi:apolipoprotein N-acyltransferase